MPSVGQGGTITLRVLYRDGSNALVDPVNPRVEILDPLGASIATNLVPVRDSVGSYHYDYAVAANAALGDWTARWTGTINGAAVQGDEVFEVVAAGTILPASGATILSLEEYKTATGLTGTQDDNQIIFALEAMTDAVVNYTGRDFLQTQDAVKTYLYDGGGFLEIDDASAITAVSLSGTGYNLTSEIDYFAQPYNGPVYTWLDLAAFHGQSPKMGFTRNLDTDWGQRRLLTRSQKIEVTGSWGWPYVPKDVKQAAVWITAAFMDSPKPFISESIAGYSVTREALAETIPDRAKKILDLYIRINL